MDASRCYVRGYGWCDIHSVWIDIRGQVIRPMEEVWTSFFLFGRQFANVMLQLLPDTCKWILLVRGGTSMSAQLIVPGIYVLLNGYLRAGGSCQCYGFL